MKQTLLMWRKLEPERNDLPITVFVVLDEMGIPVFCAAYPQACNDYISTAIVEREIHSAGLWVVREYTLDARTRSQKLADVGFTRRPSLRAMDMGEALELIAAPIRPDGTWNRDREACRELAAEALARYDDSETPNASLSGNYLPAADAADEIEQLAAAKEQHFAQAMTNGAKAREYRDEAEALRKDATPAQERFRIASTRSGGVSVVGARGPDAVDAVHERLFNNATKD